MFLDINNVIGDEQLAGFKSVIAARNLALAKSGADVRFGEPRRRISNVNVPYASADVAPSIAAPLVKEFAQPVSSDARDQNEVYRERPSEGGVLESKSQTKETIRGVYGIAGVFRRLAATIPQRIDILESLDQGILKLTKDSVNSDPELRAAGPQWLDPGLNLQPGTDAAGSPTTGLLLGMPVRRCCPIKPGIIIGKGEQLLGTISTRRTTAWGAAFEIDLYMVCLESKLESIKAG